GGRAPQLRWGQGSLQEIDHVPFVRPLTKLAATALQTAEIPGLLDDAVRAALSPPGGPAFVDFPLDQVFMEASEPGPPPARPQSWLGAGAEAAAVDRVASLLREAERPAIIAGPGIYWGRGVVA